MTLITRNPILRGMVEGDEKIITSRVLTLFEGQIKRREALRGTFYRGPDMDETREIVSGSTNLIEAVVSKYKIEREQEVEGEAKEEIIGILRAHMERLSL